MPFDPSTAFVSYSREDLDFVLRLATDLKAKGAKIWMDDLELVPGQNWSSEIDAAIQGCSRMIVVLSPAASASKEVQSEFSLALENGKEVIPVLYCDCDVPYRLRPLQHADFRNDYDAGIQKLLTSLGVKNIKQPRVPKATPKVVPAISTEENLLNLQQQAESGDVAAMMALANIYDAGKLVIKNPFLAADWYQKAADAGNPSAMWRLGFCYHTGKGVKRDLDEAVRRYRSSAEAGDPDGMYQLGWMYEYGQGVAHSYYEAEKWYTKAARERPQAVEEALEPVS